MIQILIHLCCKSVNEAQHSYSCLTHLFIAIVFIVGPNEKLTHSNDNCCDGCYIVKQRVDESPVESVGGFHNQLVWEVGVENSSTTNVDYQVQGVLSRGCVPLL